MTWRKSSHSADGDCCVWVDIRPEGVDVTRTGHEGAGYILSFTHAEWAAFLAGARAGEFDLEQP